jgi:hypothetical protein
MNRCWMAHQNKMKFSGGRRPRQENEGCRITPNHQHTLKMETELVAETVEELQILTRVFSCNKSSALSVFSCSATFPHSPPTTAIYTVPCGQPSPHPRSVLSAELSKLFPMPKVLLQSYKQMTVALRRRALP